jgi:pimeloyl-ACP methyl ester carboxylesterase
LLTEENLSKNSPAEETPGAGTASGVQRHSGKGGENGMGQSEGFVSSAAAAGSPPAWPPLSSSGGFGVAAAGQANWREAGVGRGLRELGRVAPDVSGRLAFSFLTHPSRRALTDEDTALRAAASEEATVMHGRVPLRAYAWGADRDAPTVLLVHGWGAHATSRTGALIPVLREAGWRVVAFDGPGHGLSGGRHTDLFDFGQAVRAVNESLGPASAVVAHSFGAASTLWTLAHQHDDRIQRIAVFGPPSDFSYMVSVLAGRLDLPESVVRGVDRAFARRYGFPPAMLSVRGVAAAVGVPGLVVHDLQDGTVAYEEGAALAAAWPSATLLTTDGLGHSGTLHDAAVQRRLVAFLEGARREVVTAD